MDKKTEPHTSDSQAYYWEHGWQQGEQESRRELAAGITETFANADEAIRWLLSGHALSEAEGKGESRGEGDQVSGL